DGRNIYDPIEMARLHFSYRGMGRGYGPDGAPLTEESLKEEAGAGVVSDASQSGEGPSPAEGEGA
ncbi:MAG: hypothetical protein PVJ32_03640, partial [Anaerolineales bacterium]